MTGDTVQLVAVIAALLVISIAYAIAQWAARRRRAPYRAFAAAHGFRYAVHAPQLRRWWSGPPFGRAGTVQNVVSGQLGPVPFVSFDYRWTQRASEIRTPSRFVRVGVLALPGPLPPLQVDPDTSRLGGLGRSPAGEVDVESEEFNRRFRVRVDADYASRRCAMAVLNPRAVEALLTAPDFSWRVGGAELIGWWPVGPPEVAHRHLLALARVAECVPDFAFGRPSAHSPGESG